MSRRHTPFWPQASLAALTLLVVAAFAIPACRTEAAPNDARAETRRIPVKDTKTYQKPSDADLKKSLTAMQYEVTQKDATEPPFRNAFWNNKGEGLYVDVTTGEPLFSSKDKFDSGTGWPSFTRPVDDARVVEKRDASHGMVRVEVRSKAGNAHLGHVFDDGPRPTGLRYCINSASLRFIAKDDLEKEGYGAYRVHFDGVKVDVEDTASAICAPGEGGMCETSFETAVLAGGCFWGMEDLLRKIPGVLETEVGYAGGETDSPTYNSVKTGRTGHAESVRVVFDPSVLSYADLLEKWFFKMHDPTTLNQQGNDRGTQYRSAIFYTTDAQKKTAEDIKRKVDQSGKWKRPIVTEIVKAGAFTAAEDYHQDYLEKNPGGYTCHFMRD